MLKRILTALVGLIVFFAVIFSPEPVFKGAVLVIIFGALYEIYKAEKAGIHISIAGIISAILLLAGTATEAVAPMLILSMMIFMIMSIFRHGREDYKKIYSSAFLTVFVTLFFERLIAIRAGYGVEGMLLVFIFAWITDTGAYFTGCFFGKHKLIPNVSPKKTLEGAIGGIAWTVVITVCYLALLKNVLKIPEAADVSYIGIGILAIVASVLSQLGDLVASSVKRDCGVKDFGTLFPGHGGIMDRFDSVLFISPVVYYFLEFITKSSF